MFEIHGEGDGLDGVGRGLGGVQMNRSNGMPSPGAFSLSHQIPGIIFGNGSSEQNG